MWLKGWLKGKVLKKGLGERGWVKYVQGDGNGVERGKSRQASSRIPALDAEDNFGIGSQFTIRMAQCI